MGVWVRLEKNPHPFGFFLHWGKTITPVHHLGCCIGKNFVCHPPLITQKKGPGSFGFPHLFSLNTSENMLHIYPPTHSHLNSMKMVQSQKNLALFSGHAHHMKTSVPPHPSYAATASTSSKVLDLIQLCSFNQTEEGVGRICPKKRWGLHVFHSASRNPTQGTIPCFCCRVKGMRTPFFPSFTSLTLSPALLNEKNIRSSTWNWGMLCCNI